MKNSFVDSTGQGVHIAIIDSGAKLTHPLLKNMKLTSESVAIHYSSGVITISRDIEDHVGHGTALCGIFSKLIPDSSLTVIKVFDHEDLHAEEPHLISALDYVLDSNIFCDILHLSLGISIPSKELWERCKRIRMRGTLIISAYDNAGNISYPAFYDEVIGVDSDIRLKRHDDFYVIDDKNATILAKGGSQRLAWIEPDYIISKGSSFSAGYVTAYAAKMLTSGIRKEDVLQGFKQIAKKTVDLQDTQAPNLSNIPFEIRHAALFPYNKEMHSLINYADKLSFSLDYICDSKYTGRIGKVISNLDNSLSFTVHSISNLAWESIDTLILGHLDELDEMTGLDEKSFLLRKCLENNVNVYSFDTMGIGDFIQQFEARNLHLYIPQIDNAAHTKKYMNKLFEVSKPIIAVFGTSSRQGKFTLQLALRYSFMSQGYSVGQLGTEPSALLYGLDACFPIGHNSTVKLDSDDFVKSLNFLMHEIDIRHPENDVILTGCQSGTVPLMYTHLSQISFIQTNFLVSIMADAVIVCVNPEDDLDYIIRTIKAIEGMGATTVIAIALYPMVFQNPWFQANNIRKRMEKAEMKRKELTDSLGLPVFIIGDTTETDLLRDHCIQFLSE